MNIAANTAVVSSDTVQPGMVNQFVRGKSSLNSLAKSGDFAELLDENAVQTAKNSADESKSDQQDPGVVSWPAFYHPAGGINLISADEACSSAVAAINFAGDQGLSPANLTGAVTDPLVASPFAHQDHLGEGALLGYNNGVLANSTNDIQPKLTGSELQSPETLPDGPLSPSQPTSLLSSSMTDGTGISLAGQPVGLVNNSEIPASGPNVLVTGQFSNTANSIATVYTGSDQPVRQGPMNLMAGQAAMPVTADTNQPQQQVQTGLTTDSQISPIAADNQSVVVNQPGKVVFTGAVPGDKPGGLSVGQNDHGGATIDNNGLSSPTVLTTQTATLGEKPDGFSMDNPPDSLDSSVIRDSTGNNDDSAPSSLFARLLENNSQLNGLSANKTELKSAGETGSQLSDVPAQIIKQINLTKGPLNSQMVIQLQPEHLGQLTLKVAVENGLVSATFHSDNPDVRGIIQSSLPELRQEITNQGLKVDYVGVYAGLGQFTSGGRQGNYSQPEPKVINLKDYQDTIATGEEDGVSTGAVSGTASAGVDYRI